MKTGSAYHYSIKSKQMKVITKDQIVSFMTKVFPANEKNYTKEILSQITPKKPLPKLLSSLSYEGLIKSCKQFKKISSNFYEFSYGFDLIYMALDATVEDFLELLKKKKFVILNQEQLLKELK